MIYLTYTPNKAAESNMSLVKTNQNDTTDVTASDNYA